MMNEKLARKGRKAGRGRRWWPVAAGFAAVLAGLLAFSTLSLAPGEPAGELAPDITLSTLQGDFRLSEARGAAVALYFSFVG